MTADEIIEGVIQGIQKEIGIDDRVNAMRAFLRQDPIEGLIEREQAEGQTLIEFKARLFEEFFQFYGSRMPSALRMWAAQRLRSKSGAERKQQKGAETVEKVTRTASELRKKGVPARSIATRTAEKLRMTGQHVRGILRKAKETEG